jgi:trimeric autotransporter adhesin
MSTKTLRKRIALVAVSALTAGLVSVVAVPTANAALDGQGAIAAATTYPNVCAVAADNKSAVSKVGGIVKYTPAQATGTDDTFISLTGTGRFITSANVTYNASGEAVVASDSDFVLVEAMSVGTITLGVKNATGGADAYKVTISVVAECAAAVPSASYSFARTVIAGNADLSYTYDNPGSTDNALTSSVDDYTNAAGTGTAYDANKADYVVPTNQKTVGTVGYIYASLKDAYNNSLPTTGVVTVTATGAVKIGAVVSGSSAPTTSSAKTYVVQDSGAAIAIAVEQDATQAPTLSTITIAYDGVVYLTKTIAFGGKPATVKAIDSTVGSVGGVGYVQFQVQDAAGNPVSAVVSNDATANAASVAISGGITTTGTSSATTGKTPATDASSGRAEFTCLAGGKTTLVGRVPTDSSNLTYVKTAPFTVNCGGALDTWTIAFDKASYQPGEIATLTVSGKDSKGFGVNSAATMAGLTSSFGGMTAVVAPTTADTFSSGVGIKTYQFAVGTSEGSFVGTLKIDGATDATAKTVQYKVAAAAGAVSNADVLKAIVSLIASINKQIAALQKALLRR